MRLEEIHKALGNESRLNIMKWLRDPDNTFRPHKDGSDFSNGVCVKLIQEHSGLSQSTTSLYLTTLHRCGLVIATRIGKWTYYKRNEETIRLFILKMEQSI